MPPKKVAFRLNAELIPSSGKTGFFQPNPVLENQFLDDHAFQQVANFFLPSDTHNQLHQHLSSFADVCIRPDILALAADAERNQPYLSTHSPLGVPESTLITSEGWRKLAEIQRKEGIIAIPFQHSPIRNLDLRLGENGEVTEFARKTADTESSMNKDPAGTHIAHRDHLMLKPAFSRLHQFLKYHLWCPSSAIVTCPGAMTDGAAKLLEQQILSPHTPSQHRQVFIDAFYRLTSKVPGFGWTSGQWMTERTGGSDIRRTETCAFYRPASGVNNQGWDGVGNPLGEWSIHGFKWFSSATDSDCCVLLARTGEDQISAFYAPLRRQIPGQVLQSTGSASRTGTKRSTLNGIEIQRLKPKLGTKALPTAELVLTDLRAYPIGRIGKGTREISTVLNITRIHNAVSAVGGFGRGLGIARAYARVRKIDGGTRLLRDVPAHVRTMAAAHLSYRAHLFITFLTVTILGTVEADGYATMNGWSSAQSGCDSFTQDRTRTDVILPSSTAERAGLLRLFTPVVKILTAKAAISGLSECCEMLGGVGYMEYPHDITLNIARLLRDSQVLSIWEGTSDVLSEDLIRVLKGHSGERILQTFNGWVNTNLVSADTQFSEPVLKRLRRLNDAVVSEPSSELLLYRGREIAGEIGWITSAVLLVLDIHSSKKGGKGSRDRESDDLALNYGREMATEIARRWIRLDGWTSGPYFNSPLDEADDQSVERAIRMDRWIVFGPDEPIHSSGSSKL